MYEMFVTSRAKWHCPLSQRRTNLRRWFENDLLPLFQQRILPATHSIADRWGVVDGQCQLNGTPLGTADGMIAATALEHDLTLVIGVQVFNPWDEA
jgi:predicted nucleic acid-binding protein